MAPASKKTSFLFSTKRLFQKGGITSFYRGFMATASREVVGNIALFTTYQVKMMLIFKVIEVFWSFTFFVCRIQLFKNSICKMRGVHPHDASYDVIVFSGGMSGVGFWLISHPFDTLKSLIQTDSFTSPKYKGVIDCIRVVRAYHKISFLYSLVLILYLINISHHTVGFAWEGHIISIPRVQFIADPGLPSQRRILHYGTLFSILFYSHCFYNVKMLHLNNYELF